MSYFPMYVELENESCLIVGGGTIAYHKALVLREFKAKVTVVAPEISKEIKVIPEIVCIEREFTENDLEAMKVVVAATDDSMLNHEISKSCMERKIPINAVDQIEDCSFIFPSYLKEGEVVASFSSGGASPVITQYLKKEVKPLMTVLLGAMADCLKSLRPEVKQTVADEKRRKELYQEILALGLLKGEVPTDEEVFAVLQKYQG